MTERARYRFTVKTYADGSYFIAAEPIDRNIAKFDDGIFGFDLRSGTGSEEAQRIASFFCENIEFVTYTDIPEWKRNNRR